AHRLPETMALHATHLCTSGGSAHGRPGRNQGALLSQHERAQSQPDRAKRAAAGLSAALSLFLGAAQASSDPFADLTDVWGAAIGPIMRLDRSPYRGAGTRRDFIPMYLYEGDLVSLRSNSVGLKFGPSRERRIELFL